MKKKYVPKAVISRLPKYHRCLKDLINKDIRRISSKQLSNLMGFTASQIRQDLNNFGDFGQQGYGYNVEDLYGEISKILGLNRNYNVAIIGAGNLGNAIANYTQFDRLGFKASAIFDINPDLIGKVINNVQIRHMDDFEKTVKEQDIEIVYLCTGMDVAQSVAEKIEKTSVKAILNFAPTDLIVGDEIVVENTYIIDKLLAISYHLKTARKK